MVTIRSLIEATQYIPPSLPHLHGARSLNPLQELDSPPMRILGNNESQIVPNILGTELAVCYTASELAGMDTGVSSIVADYRTLGGSVGKTVKAPQVSLSGLDDDGSRVALNFLLSHKSTSEQHQAVALVAAMARVNDAFFIWNEFNRILWYQQPVEEKKKAANQVLEAVARLLRFPEESLENRSSSFLWHFASELLDREGSSQQAGRPTLLQTGKQLWKAHSDYMHGYPSEWEPFLLYCGKNQREDARMRNIRVEVKKAAKMFFDVYLETRLDRFY